MALLITNDDGDNESDEFQHVGVVWRFLPGKPLWLEGKFKINDATQSDFFFGLCVTDTTLIDGVQDAAFFQKDDGDLNLDYHSDKDNTESTGDTGKDMANATYAVLGIKWDGVSTVSFWVNGEQVGSDSTNVNDDELMRISFAIQNGTTVAETLHVANLEAFMIL